MTQAESRKLDAGDFFPRWILKLTDDSSLSLPADLAGKWGIVLIYRGHW